jgi:hypothetical protein
LRVAVTVEESTEFPDPPAIAIIIKGEIMGASPRGKERKKDTMMSGLGPVNRRLKVRSSG